MSHDIAGQACGNSNTVLVVDQGTHSTRALLFADDGVLLASAAAPVASTFPHPAFVEQSPQQVLQSARDALAGLAGQLKSTQLAGIACAALIVQRSSMLACRRDSLEPITPVISWQDTRNQEIIRALQPRHAEIKAITGLRPNAHYGASKMRWLLDNDPAVQQAAAENNLLFSPLAAWLAATLTAAQECVVDPVIASRTLLMGLHSAAWHPQLLQWFGIAETMLPAIVSSDHAIGFIRVGSRPVPLALVGGDQSFIPFAGGVPIDPDTAYVNVGTGAFVRMPLPATGGDERLLSSPLVVTAHERVVVMEGTVNAAATALDWLWQQAGHSLSHAAVAQALADQHSPPVFINVLAGTGSPWWLPAQTPCFIGDGSLPARAVAVLESIVFALMDNIASLQQANPQLGKLVIGGGLSQLDGFCQRLANLAGLRVVRPALHEISALGAAAYVLHGLSVMYGPASGTGGDEFLPQADAVLYKRYNQHQDAMRQRVAFN